LSLGLYLIAIGLTGVDRDLHSPILGSASVGVIWLTWLRFAFTNRVKPIDWNANRLQLRTGGWRTPL